MSIYNGCQNKDVDGKDCLNWLETYRDVLNKEGDYHTKFNIPTGYLVDNYCRNLELKEEGLACYVWKDAP